MRSSHIKHEVIAGRCVHPYPGPARYMPPEIQFLPHTAPSNILVCTGTPMTHQYYSGA